MRLPVGTFDMPTGKAALRGVAWINHPHLHARPFRFVDDELSKLRESPIAVPRPVLAASNPGPRANVRQVFQRNPSVRAFGVENESLADLVVDVLLKASLPARQLPEMASGRFRAALLQITAQALLLAAVVFNRRARLRSAVAGRGDVSHAQINAQGRIHVTLVGIRNFACRQQVERAVAVDQIAFTLAVAQEFVLALTRLIGDAQPSSDAPNRDGVVVGIPRQNPVIVANRPVRLERARRVPVEFVGVGHLRQAADHDLRRQATALTRGVVGRCLQVKTPEFLQFPRLLAEPVAQAVGLFQRLQQVRPLFMVGQQFDLSDQLHI